MNYAVPRKRAIFTQAETGFTPADLRQAYNIPADLDGSGQTIALLEFGSGYSKTDINTFARDVAGLTSYDIHFVSLYGTPDDGGTDPVDLEATLDIQWALAIAPKARIVVYEAPAGDSYPEFGHSLERALRYVVNDQQFHPSIVSISYGDAEQNFDQGGQGLEVVLAQAAKKNVSVFVASGDQGAYGEHCLDNEKIRRVDFPASCPHAIAVGGTTLHPDPYREKAWTATGLNSRGATGGGFSTIFDAPDYQATHLRRFDTTMRGVPDVAAVADPATGCVVIFEGKRQTVGGTSLAAPIWAGITALVNQALGKPAGFFLPQLYADPAGLRDITSGNNSFNSVPGYSAGPGWDPCTGLGSPDVSRWLEQLKGKPDKADTALGRSNTVAPPPSVVLALVLGLVLVVVFWAGAGK